MYSVIMAWTGNGLSPEMKEKLGIREDLVTTEHDMLGGATSVYSVEDDWRTTG